MTRWRVLALVLLVLGAGGAVALYLFRVRSEESPLYGKAMYRYRWGRPYEIRVDFNRDGNIDYRAIVPGVFGAGIVPIESWQDPAFEGFFRYHVVFEGGEPSVVEIDEDGDGNYETRLQGEAARALVLTTLSPSAAGNSEVNKPPSPSLGHE